MAAYSTIVGWAVIVSLTGGYYYIYNKKDQKNPRVANSKQGAKAIETRKEPRSKAKAAEKAPKKKAPKAEPEVPSFSPSSVVDDREDEANNREFARQLQSVKTGTVMTGGKSQTAAKQKSVKQSKAQEKPLMEVSSDNATAPSSATGGDADDDESPINSPELNATSMASPIPVCTHFSKFTSIPDFTVVSSRCSAPLRNHTLTLSTERWCL